jgi:glycosyltransferase involved in cell wall biosynthesis
MVRVLFFGTHPSQYNGYSKVVYELMSCLSTKQDMQFTVYGFQKFNSHQGHRDDLPSNIEVYDAFESENPRQQGFGITEVRSFVNKNKPDVCIVYNDMMILHQVISQLKLAQKEDGLTFKIIAYIDQVYLNQKKEFIDFINTNADYALMFTKYWEDIAIEQGITLPHGFLPHGFNKEIYYPIPKHLCRLHYGLREEDFVILNLNRNQPRKRWDVCLKAFAEIVSRYPREPIKMMVGTAVQGAWNLIEIYERELKKRGLTLQDGMQHLIVFDRPQRVTDEETNILYNIADIGINTCDGEGFGLCNFEQAALGVPQVVPRLGGFIDFFDDESAALVDPKIAYYVDNTRDAVCGEALMCDYVDFVEAIEQYYFNKERRQKHGTNGRTKILRDYKWSDIADKLYGIIKEVCGVSSSSNTSQLIDEIEKIDLSLLQKLAKNKNQNKTEPETIAKEKESESIPILTPPQSPTPVPVPVSVPTPEPVIPTPEAIALTTTVPPPTVEIPVVAAPTTEEKKDTKSEKEKKKAKRQKELLKLKKKLAELIGDSDDDDDSDDE